MKDGTLDMIAPEDGTEAYGLVCDQLGYDAMGVPASEDDDRKFEEYRWCGDLGSLEGAILDRCEKLNMSSFFDGMLSVFWAELSYGAPIAMALSLLDSDGCASTVMLVVIGSVLAQVWNSMQTSAFKERNSGGTCLRASAFASRSWS